MDAGDYRNALTLKIELILYYPGIFLHQEKVVSRIMPAGTDLI